MKELNFNEILEVSGGRKFRWHVNLTMVFSAIGATIFGGPAAGGAVVAAMIAAQGTGQAYDLLTDPNIPQQ